MPVPQAITDALNALQTDQDNVTAAGQAADASQKALADAKTKADSDAATVTATKAHQATDLAALQALLTQTYGGQ